LTLQVNPICVPGLSTELLEYAREEVARIHRLLGDDWPRTHRALADLSAVRPHLDPSTIESVRESISLLQVRSPSKPSGAPHPATLSPEDHRFSLFRKRGDFWDVRFRGERGAIKDLAGMKRLAILLRSEGKQVPSTELVGRIAPFAGDPMLDGKSIENLKHREEELRHQLDGATDPADRAELREELSNLEKHRNAAVGRRGQARRQVDDLLRAASSCGMSIKRAINSLRVGGLRLLADHLEESLCGVSSRAPAYLPKERVDWLLD
jgi:hypothetical protein